MATNFTSDYGKQILGSFSEAAGEISLKLGILRHMRPAKTEMGEFKDTSNGEVWVPRPGGASSFDSPVGTDISANYLSRRKIYVPIKMGTIRGSAFSMEPGDFESDGVLQQNLHDSLAALVANAEQVALSTFLTQSGLTVKRTQAAGASNAEEISHAVKMRRQKGRSTGSLKVIYPSEYEIQARAPFQATATSGLKMNEDMLKYADPELIMDLRSATAYAADMTDILTAAAATGVTVNGANQNVVPSTHQVHADGTKGNLVDANWQTFNITLGGGSIKAGDRFTIPNVFATHATLRNADGTKKSTGFLQPFTVRQVVSGGVGAGACVVRITPQIVSSTGGNIALMYQNVTATPANGAALTFLNTADTHIIPFLDENSLVYVCKDMPAIPNIHTRGLRINASLPLGNVNKMLKMDKIPQMNVAIDCEYNMDTMITNIVMRSSFGVSMLDPERCGVILTSQT